MTQQVKMLSEELTDLVLSRTQVVGRENQALPHGLE